MSQPGRRRTPGRKILSRAYTALIALLCTAAVAYAIHADSKASRAGRAAAKAQEWEHYARTMRSHRQKTAKSLKLLVRRYNTLARNATAEQRLLLANLAKARRRAAKAQPSGALPVVYASTKAIVISQPAPAASAAPAAPSQPTTKTS
jgi:hypothetical protein